MYDKLSTPSPKYYLNVPLSEETEVFKRYNLFVV
jgi:hypothetical protein